MLDIKWKVERSGNDAVITVIVNGIAAVKRETGQKAAALMDALESNHKLGVLLGGLTDSVSSPVLTVRTPSPAVPVAKRRK